jgi:hypothetical protein
VSASAPMRWVVGVMGRRYPTSALPPNSGANDARGGARRRVVGRLTPYGEVQPPMTLRSGMSPFGPAPIQPPFTFDLFSR